MSLYNLRGVLLTVSLFFLALPLAAQFETATVLGAIRDNSQGGIAGAKVILKNIGTGVATEIQTDQQGAFEIFNVRIGRYVVRASSRRYGHGGHPWRGGDERQLHEFELNGRSSHVHGYVVSRASCGIGRWHGGIYNYRHRARVRGDDHQFCLRGRVRRHQSADPCGILHDS